MDRDSLRLLLRAGMVVALVDAIFATSLSVFAYGSTAPRLWRGVAATVLGTGALDGGIAAMLFGLLLHTAVAFTWTAALIMALSAAPSLRAAIASPAGAAMIAFIYGPMIWMIMSMLVIPLLTGRSASVTPRWWVQLAGHVGFVALPMVVTLRASMRREPRLAPG